MMSSIQGSQPIASEKTAAERAAGSNFSRAARGIHFTLLLASLGVLAATYFLEVRGTSQVAVPLVGTVLPELCYWRQMFDLDCPGCGLTRCFIALAHADLAAAWRYNPAGTLLFAAVVFQVPYRSWQLWRLATGRGEYQTLCLSYGLLGMSVLLILQWFWRMMA